LLLLKRLVVAAVAVVVAAVVFSCQTSLHEAGRNALTPRYTTVPFRALPLESHERILPVIYTPEKDPPPRIPASHFGDIIEPSKLFCFCFLLRVSCEDYFQL